MLFCTIELFNGARLAKDVGSPTGLRRRLFVLLAAINKN